MIIKYLILILLISVKIIHNIINIERIHKRMKVLIEENKKNNNNFN